MCGLPVKRLSKVQNFLCNYDTAKKATVGGIVFYTISSSFSYNSEDKKRRMLNILLTWTSKTVRTLQDYGFEMLFDRQNITR